MSSGFPSSSGNALIDDVLWYTKYVAVRIAQECEFDPFAQLNNLIQPYSVTCYSYHTAPDSVDKGSSPRF